MKKNKTEKLLIVPTRTKGIRIFHPEQYEKAKCLAEMLKTKIVVVSI